jgi:hypothetical protein
MGGASELPERIRERYTHGEQAALVIVVREVMKKGCCDLCIDQIAAMAGVGRTTVQNALRKARDDENAHVAVEERPRPGRKNLTNVIRIISREWVDWLKRRIGFKAPKPTKKPVARISLSECAATLQGAYERERAATAASIRTVSESVLDGNALSGWVTRRLAGMQACTVGLMGEANSIGEGRGWSPTLALSGGPARGGSLDNFSNWKVKNGNS